MSYPADRRRTKIRRQDKARTVWMFVLTALIAVALVRAEQAADRTTRLAMAAQQQTADIQAQRIETIQQQCYDQDMRHDNAVIALARTAGVHIVLVTPQVRAQLARGPLALAVAIIDNALPYKDCRAVVQKETGYDPTNPNLGGLAP